MRRSTAIRKRKQKPQSSKAGLVLPVESVAKAKSAFIANISHEIRTPMNAIMGFAQMLKNSGLNEQQNDYVDVILDSGKKLLLIISNLLDLSNLQLGRTTLNPRPCQPAELADKLWQHFKPLVLAKNLSPILEIQPDIPEVLVDAGKLERVVGYMISNAIKYTSSGFVALRICCSSLSNGDLQLCIEIADSGIGISEELLPKIFDVFEQGDSSITRPYGGMGIGLGLSQQIVALMGGSIRVQSKQGEGSRFFIELPVTPASNGP